MKEIKFSAALLWLAVIACAFTVTAHAELKLHWKLDEIEGQTAVDSSASAFPGLWQGTAGQPMWMPGGGIDGGAIQFTGANRDTFIAEGLSEISGLPFTMSVWVKTTTTANTGVAYLGNGSGSSYYVVRVSGNTARTNARNTTEQAAVGSTPINNDEWHHIAAVYEGSALRRLYVDGRFEATNTSEVPPLTLTRFGLGALTRNTPYNPADLYTGLVDDAAIWDRPFTAMDAAAVNGLGILKAGNASHVDPLLAAFTARQSVIIRGRKWEYATGFGSTLGETGGSVAGLSAYIVLDDEGNRMQMTSDPGNPVVVEFKASPPNTFPGQPSTLSWQVGDSTSISISPGIGSVANGSGSVMVNPATTTTYTLTATNANGSATATANVTVNPNPVISSFTASPVSIFSGQPITLSWNAANFTAISIDQGVSAITGATGEVVVSPNATTTYTFTASNASSTVSATATVTVLPKAQPVVYWNFDESGGAIAVDTAGDYDGAVLGDAVLAPGTGVLGGALMADGIDDVVRLEGPPIMEYPFVISGWVNTTGLLRQITAYLGDGSSTDRYYAIGVSNGSAYIAARDATSFLENTGPTVNDGTWHQLVGVFESDVKRTLYVDGLMAVTQTQPKPFIASVNRFSAGRLDRVNPADPTLGSVDDVGLWTGSFTSPEVMVLHALGRLGVGLGSFREFSNAFTARSSVIAGSAVWNYASGLLGVAGESGGSIGAGDAFIVFDDMRNGMRVSGFAAPAFTSVRRNADGSIALTWRSLPGANYRTEFSRNLTSWTVIHPSLPSGGGTTQFTYSSALGPEPATEPLLYFRAIQLP